MSLGDNLDSIASGPTVPDTSTFSDSLYILEKHKIKHKVPSAVIEFLEKGVRGDVEETPTADDPVFKRVQNVIIGSNIQAVTASKQKARRVRI